MSLVAISGLVKRYGDKTVLDALDLTLRAGEVLALLGPNGAGKTTLVSIVAGLLRPTSGQVELCGAPISELDEAVEAGRLKVDGTIWLPTRVHERNGLLYRVGSETARNVGVRLEQYARILAAAPAEGAEWAVALALAGEMPLSPGSARSAAPVPSV